jgi:hypothetical protein
LYGRRQRFLEAGVDPDEHRDAGADGYRRTAVTDGHTGTDRYPGPHRDAGADRD